MGTNWCYTGDADLSGSATSSGNYFGTSIDLSTDGDTIVVGAPQGAGAGPGFIRVFARTLNTLNGNDNWNKIVGFSGSTTGEGFGTDVAINSDGTIIAVGSPFRSGDNGRVSIFVKSGSTFSLSKTINGDSDSNFGISVDLNDQTVIYL